jgi:hypothetical protein
VAPSGGCILVSDQKLGRIYRFDSQGNAGLSFGTKGRFSENGIYLRKPAGLALDAQGNLYVADRNNSRVEKLGLPDGRPALIVPEPKPGDERIAMEVIDPDDGGKVQRKDKAAVDIPARAVDQDLTITIGRTRQEDPGEEAKRLKRAEAAGLRAVSPPVEYGPEGARFKEPVVLTLPYDPALLALHKASESGLKVQYWNKDKAVWEALESEVDDKEKVARAKTGHFSLYQVFADSGAVSEPTTILAAADDAFAYRDFYIFPSPSRGPQRPTVRVQVGVADSVDIRIYDVSGQMVHSASAGGPRLIDDNNGKGPQYTYDYVWDTGNVGSGVYTVSMAAKKSGYGPIQRLKKVGIVK